MGRGLGWCREDMGHRQWEGQRRPGADGRATNVWRTLRVSRWVESSSRPEETDAVARDGTHIYLEIYKAWLTGEHLGKPEAVNMP